MGRTLSEKVWDEHVVRTAEGEPDLLYVDLHLIHEVTSPQAFEGLRLAGRPVRRPDLTLATEDHNVPTLDIDKPIADPVSRTQVETLRKNAEEFGVRLHPLGDVEQGIVHVVGPQLGLTQPGMTIACGRVWVARTCSTSLVPMPNARAPNAPWVDVWLSPHTIVIPGWVTPSSGPMMWTIPCRALRMEKSGMPNSSALRSRASICALERGSAMPCSRPMVGTLWSTVASVRSGRRTVRPARRRPSNACGEVTSWTRWRSM